MSFSSLEEFTSEPIVIKPVVENSEAKASEAKPKVVRKNNGAPIIEDWVFDNEEDDVSQAKIEKKTFNPSFAKIEFVKPKQQEKTARKTGNPQMDLEDQGVIDSGCSRHMTWNMSYLTDYEEIDGGYVGFGGNPKGGKITGRDQKVKVIRCDNGTEFKNKEMNQFCERKGIKREFSVARTPQQNGVAERKNRTLIEAARTMLADSKLPTTFWAEAVNIACYITLGKFDGTKACDDAGKARMESVPGKDYILLPLWTADPPFSQISKSSPDAGFKPSSDDGKKVDEDSRNSKGIDQEKEDNVNNTNNVNAANTNEVNVVCGKTSIELPDDPNMPPLEDIVYSDDDEDVGAEADMNNLDAFMLVSPIPTTKRTQDLPVEKNL
ncbi:putative ribonuclease H-like domain-containing protein [Tanacetum coccineum]|uniref:Ribonuclease H-like domain-containing protein n=1 Tax=Tanacetum coccineum TaxID=301880 RepID=A0ABQ4WXW8_9ASTR